MTRGNQRDVDRERAARRQAKKAPKATSSVDKESVAEIMRRKQAEADARRAAEASNASSSSEKYGGGNPMKMFAAAKATNAALAEQTKFHPKSEKSKKKKK